MMAWTRITQFEHAVKENTSALATPANQHLVDRLRAELEAELVAKDELFAALDLVFRHYQEVDGDVIAPRVRAALAKARNVA